MYIVKHGQEGVVIANGNYPAGLKLGDATQEQLAELQAAMPHLIAPQPPIGEQKQLEGPVADLKNLAKKPTK